MAVTHSSSPVRTPGKGDVILSGDPDGGRPDLFWDTGEASTFPGL